MRKQLFARSNPGDTPYSSTQLLIDAVLFSTLFLLPNLLMALSFSTAGHITPRPWMERVFYFVEQMDVTTFLFWLLANLGLGLLLVALRHYVVRPLFSIAKQLYGMLGTLTQEPAPRRITLISMRNIAGDMTRIAQIAHEYYLKHRDTSIALMQAREAIHQITLQQHVIVNSTSREMVKQYQSVLAYANYLEERIAAQAASPDLRYDFDEVSESSFNLKIIAGAMGLAQQQAAPATQAIDVAQLMQQTMLALAPSLDRRAMKLTTVEVDMGVIALSDPAIVAHALWMLLLGTIRYAADESTLRLRCLYNRERSRALISIVVSELSPGRLDENERSIYLARQIQHMTPHMFAGTIRIHANMQLAEMLLARLDGQLTILPLTTRSCEICLNLPAAPNL